MNGTLENEIIGKIRRLARALAAKSDAALKPFGLASAERGVLEMLYPDQAMPVPQIARRLGVSRQHIQVTVNGLKENGLIILGNNPDHARSPLLVLTEKGRLAFAAIHDVDKDLIETLFQATPAAEKVITARVLTQLLEKL